MRRRHSEQSADINAIEREMADLEESIRPLAELETTTAEQAREIEKLKMQLQKSDKNVGMEKQRGEKEKVLRLEAERKLKGYVDAQKKIAAQFA